MVYLPLCTVLLEEGIRDNFKNNIYADMKKKNANKASLVCAKFSKKCGHALMGRNKYFEVI